MTDFRESDGRTVDVAAVGGALRRVMEAEGVAVLGDAGRLRALLMDELGVAGRRSQPAVEALTALATDAGPELVSSPPPSGRGVLARWAADQRRVDPGWARWAAGAAAEVLGHPGGGLGPEPSSGEPGSDVPPGELSPRDVSIAGGRQRHARGRVRLILVVIGLVAISGVIGAAVIVRSDREPASERNRSRSDDSGPPVRETDPGPRIAAEVMVGSAPLRVAVGPGAVWVLTSSPAVLGSVARIDPASNRVTATVPLDGYPADIAVDSDSVWIATTTYGGEGENTVTRLDPDSGRPLAVIPVGIDPSDLAIGAGSVWVAHGDGVVSRVDPVAERVTGAIPLPGGDPNYPVMAFGEGAIWVIAGFESTGSETHTTVYRIDPRTEQVLTTTESGFGAADVVVGGGSVWVASYAHSISRKDPGTGQTLSTIPLETNGSAVGLAVGAGSVWVASEDGTLSRVDPVTEEVTDMHLSGKTKRVAVGEGAVWVTVSDGSSVARIRP